MKSGPAASPSSHIVTRRTLADLEACPSRSWTMRLATGTTDIQVNVLGCPSVCVVMLC